MDVNGTILGVKGTGKVVMKYAVRVRYIYISLNKHIRKMLIIQS